MFSSTIAPPGEPFMAFAGRHGDRIRCGHLIVFRDGAAVQASNESHRAEPPADPAERLHMRQKFLTAWLAEIQQSFAQRRADGQANPSEWIIDELRRLKKMSVETRLELTAVEQALKPLQESDPEFLRQRALAEAREAETMRRMKLQGEINAINL